MRIVIGITGASGSIFGAEFVKMCQGDKYLISTKWGKSVLAQETGLKLTDLAPYVKKVFSDEDLSSPLASGSNYFDAMVILPCTASTLAKIASGIADSLLTRAAGVVLKERRKLILCLRETPLSSIILEQMHKLSLAGAMIMPLCPSFYQGAQTVEDQARLFAERVCQILEPTAQTTGWKSENL